MDPAKQTVPENLKSRLKASYDAMAEAYNSWLAQRSSPRLEYLDKLLALLPNPADKGGDRVAVLELGCGAGIPTTQKLLSYPTFRITANDLSTTQLKLGKEALGDDRIDWVEGDMLALDFPSESFDAIMAFYSIPFLPREEQDEMLGKIYTWLKPGGYMLANFTAEDLEAFVIEKWLDEKGWMFFSGWGADSTLDRVKATGLKVVTGDVVKESKVPDRTEASFLWVIAQKEAV